MTELARAMGRSGDLGRRHFSLIRGIEGIRVHQRMQRNRGPEYQAEVSISSVWKGALEIYGRMDGLDMTAEGPIIEEFKTSRDFEEQVPLEYGVHKLQAECYAWMWLQQEGVCPRIRLEYVHPDPSIQTRRFEWQPDAVDVTTRIEQVLRSWLVLRKEHERWRADRNHRLAALEFPFADKRPGQAELMETAARHFREGGKLYVQAPTGIGKTMGVLLPALRSLGNGHMDTLMIATCRNTGKRIFEEAARHLFSGESGIRMLTLVARERVCRETGSPCDCERCPLAKGFYDRLGEGLRELRAQKFWDADTWQGVAARHHLCPFAFMMHAAREADVLLGDLNYALDPGARLEFLFGESPGSVGVLIDEAHHVPDRSRSMISGSLDAHFLQKKIKALAPELRQILQPDIQRVLREIRSYQKGSLTEEGYPKADAAEPEALSRAVYRAMEALENSFADQIPHTDDARLDLFRVFHSFRQSMQHRQPSHVCTREGTVFQHLCLDAADWLHARFSQMSSVLLFSGTLLPLEVFMRQTGAEPGDQKLMIPSPYPSSHFRIEVEAEYPLVWKARGPELYERLAKRIVAELTTRAVKTLVYFPSYSFMDEIASRMPQDDIWLGPVSIQPRGLQEEAADDFLRPFRETKGPVCGLAVLGGALNEGIDLPGEALESVIVVSIGLPGISRERELMRRWHDSLGEEGFRMAYSLPGLVRVMQAVGRVIRGPEDRGTALLIDPRFRHPLYREYLDIRI